MERVVKQRDERKRTAKPGRKQRIVKVQSGPFVDHAKQTKTPKKSRKRAAPGATSTQDLYTGMSGQFFAMSKFLWRGYNVAVPAIDVGEDVFVVEATTDANRGMLRRVQVKTAGIGTIQNGKKVVQFNLSRAQLNTFPSHGELYYMFITRWDDMNPAMDWRFILISRAELNEIRIKRSMSHKRGRKPKDDDKSQDQITMKIEFSEQDAQAWGQSLRNYLDRWSSEWDIGSPMQRFVTDRIAIKQLLAPQPIAQSPVPNADLETK